MKRTLIFLIVFIAGLYSESSASTSISLFGRSSKQASAPSSASYALSVDPGSVEKLRGETSVTLRIPQQAFSAEDAAGSDLTLDLSAFSVIGPGTYVVIQTEQGEVPGALPTVKTFKGVVRGIPNSLAVVSVGSNGKVSGMIRTANAAYTIGSQLSQPYTAYVTKVDEIPYAADLSRCAMTTESAYDKGAKHPLTIRNTPLAATQTMKVAIDVDKACNDFFGGSQSDITNWITERFAVISSVYESEVDVAIELGRIKIYATPDPYSATDINQLLEKFTDYWAANNTGVDRTIAHLISKQDLDSPGGASGLAWLEVLCSKTNGFGVSRIMGSENFPSIDESVTAHEIGHNVGSKHTHNCDQYVPPIDSCFPAEGGCFSGTKQVIGTIMSYCNQKTFHFHPRTIPILKEAVANATCLGTLAQIQVKTDSVIFPPVALNVSKDTVLTALIKNPGSVPLTITSIQIDGIEIDSEFYLKSLPTFPLVMQPGKTQNVTVSFRPGYGGDRFGQLKITHNATGAMSIVGLHGIGAIPDPDFVLDLDFGEISGAGNHDSSLVFVENFGDAPLEISKTEITGTNAADFSIIAGGAPPKIVVQPDQTATIKVRFTATSLGQKDATLWITHNAVAPPDNIEAIDLFADVVSLLAVHPNGEASTAKLSVSPNPANDQFTIDLTGSDLGAPCVLSLVDQLGRTVAKIASEKLSGDGLHKTWSIAPSIASGTYQLVAKIGKSTLAQRVVILKQ